MTVKELIERLKEMPDQDEEVYVESYNPYAPVIGEPVFDVCWQLNSKSRWHRHKRQVQKHL